MNEFYFTQSPTTPSKPVPATWNHGGHVYTFQTDSGVFSRGKIDYGSYLLAESLPSLSGAVLDMGCGYGFLGIAAKLMNPAIRLTMVDINERAVALTQENAGANKVQAQILQGNGFEAVTERYDAILMNPPISAGKAVYYSWFLSAKEALREGGALYIVMHKKHGALSTLSFLKEQYTQADILNKDAGYHILRAMR